MMHHKMDTFAQLEEYRKRRAREYNEKIRAMDEHEKKLREEKEKQEKEISMEKNKLETIMVQLLSNIEMIKDSDTIYGISFIVNDYCTLINQNIDLIKKYDQTSDVVSSFMELINAISSNEHASFSVKDATENNVHHNITSSIQEIALLLDCDPSFINFEAMDTSGDSEMAERLQMESYSYEETERLARRMQYNNY